jgi:hypothetical protein
MTNRLAELRSEASKATTALNSGGAYRGDVINRENIGKSSAELVERWNAANPDNQVS